MTYPIMLGDEEIGKAQVERRGLYWYFRCRCRFSGEVMLRLQICCGEVCENLGIPVPENGVFRLDKRISVRSLPQGTWSVRAVPSHGPLGERFVPISPTEPFAYLHLLEGAYLQRRGGVVGAVLTDQSSSG